MTQSYQAPVTVLMTVYNGMPYLKEAVESILHQDFDDFEFLVINNGSSDASPAYLNSLDDGRLRIVHLEKNIGRTPALNHGLSLVESEYAAIIDADDISEEKRLSSQLDFLNKNPDIVLLGAGIAYIDSEGKPLGEEVFSRSHSEVLRTLPVFNQFAHAACMYRTAQAREAGGYPETFNYAQDYALWLNMIKRGGKVSCLKACLAKIRSHSGQETKRDDHIELRREEDIRLMELYLSIKGLDKESKQAAFMRISASYFLLKDYFKSFSFLKKAFFLGPLGFFSNSILWKRLKVSLERRLKKKSSS